MDRPSEISGHNTRGVLVPIDFTPVGEHAMHHGCAIARNLGCPVTLLHVETSSTESRSHSTGSELPKTDRMARYAAECAAAGVDAAPLILHGTLFGAISSSIADTRPYMMVLGTHGKQGLQHLFGSYALRVVLDASCPVLVVQAPPPAAGYSNILLPTDGGTALKAFAELLVRLPSAGARSVCLLIADASDAETEHSLQQSNAGIITALKEAGFQTILVQSADPAELPDRVIDQTGRLQADLIATMNTPPAEVPGYGYTEWNERLMFNPHKVPVLFLPHAEGQ